MISFSITNSQATNPTLLSSIIGEHRCTALIVGAIENVLGVWLHNRTFDSGTKNAPQVFPGEQFSFPLQSTKGLYIWVPFPGDTAQLTLVP